MLEETPGYVATVKRHFRSLDKILYLLDKLIQLHANCIVHPACPWAAKVTLPWHSSLQCGGRRRSSQTIRWSEASRASAWPAGSSLSAGQ